MGPLASAGELSVHLQNPDLDTSQAEQALTLASGAVVAYCGWGLALQDETFSVTGNGSSVLTLPTLRLVTVVSVVCNGTVLDLSDPIKLTWTRRGQLLRTAGWPQFALVEVGCSHGFDPLPDVIKLIVLELAARTITNPQQLTSAQVGQVSRNYGTLPRLSAMDERLLSPYVLL